MNASRLLLILIALVALTGTAGAQITIYQDSSSFDDAFARLREIDFEDVYSATVQRVTFRNPWGLNCMSTIPRLPEDTSAVVDSSRYLLLGQGATLDFPTRTRRVDLVGGSHPFRVVVTDFNDSVYTLPLDTFPRSIGSQVGLKRIQLLGEDPDGDINWRCALLGFTTFDENGDTLAQSSFNELQGEKYYLMNRPLDSYSFLPDDTTFFSPVDVHGISVMEPMFGFAGTFLFEGEARVDEDSPIGNLVIEMTPGGKIEFQTGTEGAMVMLERFHIADSAWFQVEDYDGNLDTLLYTGDGRPFDSSWVADQRFTFVPVAFGSPAGVRSITFLGSTGMYGTISVGSVWLAETPATEIARIDVTVAGLDSAGYLREDDGTRLRGALDEAIAAVKGNDRARAISLLERFRSDVRAMEGGKVLVPEEAKLFGGDAAYVISRLGVASGVRHEDDAALRAGIALDEPALVGGAARIGFTTPDGSDASIDIHDLRGQLVRAFGVSDPHAGDRVLRWDLRGADGRVVPNGVYLVTLRAAGAMVTKLVRIVR